MNMKVYQVVLTLWWIFWVVVVVLGQSYAQVSRVRRARHQLLDAPPVRERD